MENAYDYHVALITATPTEEAGVKRLYSDWTSKTFDNDAQEYYETAFERDGRTCKVVAAKQSGMGMTAGAVLTMKLIEHFRPRYIIMVGIAAGVAGAEQEYGDVIVADVIWNYSAGKFVDPAKADIQFGNVGFIPRPEMLAMDAQMEKYIRQAVESPENQCYAHVGPMACGTSVVANTEILEKQIKTQVSNTAGLDMESYAIAYAAQNATEPRPVPFIVKSICDFADSEKSDKYQKFAAYTSSEFAKLLYEKFLPV